MEHIERFFIKPGYIARQSGVYFEDSLMTSDGIVHQPDVYVYAGYLARKFDCTHILDIGCGSGHKLAKLHPEFSVIGVDFGVNIDSCRSRYPFGQWLSHDLEKPHGDLLPPEILKRTLVVCSDVIEHLVDPTGLLLTLQHCLEHAPAVILTTPERDLVRGRDNMGPPPNPAHVREWNQSELTQLLENFSFEVAFLGLTCNNDRDLEKKTILAGLHGNRLRKKRTTKKTSFLIQ
jgi:SAM-dependent methyltransferase